MHLLILSRLSFLWNNTSRIPVNMRAPASSAATAVHACNDAYCDPLAPVNTFDHDSTSTPTVLFLKKKTVQITMYRFPVFYFILFQW